MNKTQQELLHMLMQYREGVRLFPTYLELIALATQDDLLTKEEDEVQST